VGSFDIDKLLSELESEPQNTEPTPKAPAPLSPLAEPPSSPAPSQGRPGAVHASGRQGYGV